MTDARLNDVRNEPRVGAQAPRDDNPFVDPRAVDPRALDRHEDLVGEGMSPLPVIAGLLVTAAIVTGMFILAA